MKIKINDYKALTKNENKQIKDWFSKKKIKENKKNNSKNTTLNSLANDLKGKSYQEFLNSKYWSIIRAKVLKRDSYKCIICKSDLNLQVHHDTYKNHFREHKHLKDLMTLCKRCHTEHHYCSD